MGRRQGAPTALLPGRAGAGAPAHQRGRRAVPASGAEGAPPQGGGSAGRAERSKGACCCPWPGAGRPTPRPPAAAAPVPRGAGARHGPAPAPALPSVAHPRDGGPAAATALHRTLPPARAHGAIRAQPLAPRPPPPPAPAQGPPPPRAPHAGGPTPGGPPDGPRRGPPAPPGHGRLRRNDELPLPPQPPQHGGARGENIIKRPNIIIKRRDPPRSTCACTPRRGAPAPP